MNIFHGVSYRTLRFEGKEEKTVNLFVEVEENKPYYVPGQRRLSNRTAVFSVVPKSAITTLFGLNKDLWAGAEISQTGYRVETRLTEPRFLEHPHHCQHRCLQ